MLKRSHTKKLCLHPKSDGKASRSEWYAQICDLKLWWTQHGREGKGQGGSR